MKHIPFPLIVLCVLCFCSCQPRTEKRIIGFSQCSEDDWRTAMNKEALQEASFHPGIELRIKSVKDDTQQQIRDVEQFIADKVDLIVLAPNEAVPLTRVTEKAMKAGIPVVLVDRKVASPNYSAFVGADNYQIGKAAALYMAELLKGNGRIFEICGLDGSTSAAERHRGFVEAIGGYPDISVVSSVDGGWFYDVAKEKTRCFINSGQPVDLIFAHNDQMALGASDAYAEANATRPSIVGIDALAGENGGIQMVLDGRIDATFFYPTGGEYVIQTALRILDGQSYSRDNTLYTAVVDRTNARILKLQTDQIIAQQNNLAKLDRALDESISQYATQRVLLYGSLFVLMVILGLLVLLVRAYRRSNRTNRLLKERNALISNQQQKLIEQRDRLKQLSQDLEEATQAKLVFFTNISHEFRTPLTLIAGPLDQIITKESLSESGMHMALLMRQNITILQRLIEQVIDFRKVENGKMKLDFVFADFKAFIGGIVESFRPLAVSKHLHLEFSAQAEECVCWFDAEKMEKVLFNLLSNAFKYTPENGRIKVELARVNMPDGKAGVQIRVTDTGQGISEEHLPYIFERFYKANEAASGSGIGLALTKMLVELSGGTIAVESQSGKGSRFTVLVPFEPEGAGSDICSTIPVIRTEYASGLEHVSPNVTEPLESSLSQEETADKPLVLVVEDNVGMRLYLKTLLADSYTVLEACNGLEGLQMAVQQVPELIVSDVLMDVMDGFELCRQLKNRLSTCHIPIVLLTACSLDEQRAEGFESGADAYISKPFNDKLLVIRVRKLIENRTRLKEYFCQNLTFGGEKRSVTQLDRNFMDKFRQIVLERISDNELNVDEIGKNIGLSRIQLYRKVKALTNYAPNELVRMIRLKEAAKQLLYTEKSISEIAYDTGFSSPAYFTKCFKEHFKENPSEYQTRLKKQ